MNQSVTFETKCYQNDWVFLLGRGYLERMIENCNYNFDNKVLLINNVENFSRVQTYAERLVNKGIIDKYYFVHKHADSVLKTFGIDKGSFNGGYYYSIAELAGIYVCETDYLLHFSSDTLIENSTFNWIDDAIELMNKTPDILVANPTWNNKYEEAKNESFKEDEEWFYSYGFSDQCYLIKADNFRKHNYNEYHPVSERYPKYGGNLFEKRVDSYMRNRELKRITSKKVSYKHENYPKNSIRKFIKLHLSW